MAQQDSIPKKKQWSRKSWGTAKIVEVKDLSL